MEYQLLFDDTHTHTVLCLKGAWKTNDFLTNKEYEDMYILMWVFQYRIAYNVAVEIVWRSCVISGTENTEYEKIVI